MSFFIETIHEYNGSGIKAALFDFDGTISLIREGWQQIMIPYFCEVLTAADNKMTADEIKHEVTEFVDRLTGKQTIYQCIALDEAVVKRGGAHTEPIVYKNEYLRRLNLQIAGRKEELAADISKREKYTVKGAVDFIVSLKEHGIKCYLASGTDEADVIYEAALLGLENAFDGGIHGARDGLLDCSKEAVIRALIENEKLLPEELAAFGDGYVEIELVSKLGGYAVGAATDEKTSQGIDEWKRGRLLTAGADAIIPNFENIPALLSALKIQK